MATLLKRGKKWYSDLRIKGPDGKTHRIRRPLSSDKAVAAERLDELVRLRSADKLGHFTGDLSWQTFRAKHTVYSGTKKPQSAYNDRLAFQWLERLFPVRTLTQVTPELLEHYKAKMKAAGKKPTHINRCLRALKAAMRKAEDWGYIRKQNWRSVKDIKMTLREIDYFTMEELKALLAGLKGDHLTAVYLAGRAGLRRGEINHLAPSDIDFERKRINITPKDDWEPKDYERRFIPMVPDLEAHLKACLKHHGSILTGKRSDGELGWQVSLKIKDLGFKGALQKLRHTYGSHLVMAGAPMAAVSKLLGHASVDTTERHYAHLSQSHLDEQGMRLPNLGSAPVPPGRTFR